MSTTLTYDTFDITKFLSTKDELRIRIDFFLTKLIQRWFAILSEFKEKAIGVFFLAQELRYIFGKNNYQEVVGLLTAAQIIEQLPDQEKSSGFNRNMYVFRPLILEPNQRFVEIPKYIRRPYNSFSAYYSHRAKNLSKIDLELASNLSHFDIAGNIDLHDLKELYRRNYPLYIEKCLKNGYRYISEEEYVWHADQNYHRFQGFNNASLLELSDWVKVDKFGNRFHSPLTSVPKFVFNAGLLKIKGEDVIGIDQRQAQPTLLANYLGGMADNDFTDRFNQTDDIYNYFNEQVGLGSRDIGKTYVMKAINSRIESKEFQTYCELFPKAGGMLVDLKRMTISENPNPLRYTNVGFLMQQEESRIFRTLWKALMDKNIIIGTKHDCILVPKTKTEKSLKIINKEMRKSIIHCPFDFHLEEPSTLNPILARTV